MGFLAIQESRTMGPYAAAYRQALGGGASLDAWLLDEFSRVTAVLRQGRRERIESILGGG